MSQWVVFSYSRAWVPWRDGARGGGRKGMSNFSRPYVSIVLVLLLETLSRSFPVPAGLQNTVMFHFHGNTSTFAAAGGYRSCVLLASALPSPGGPHDQNNGQSQHGQNDQHGQVVEDWRKHFKQYGHSEQKAHPLPRPTSLRLDTTRTLKDSLRKVFSGAFHTPPPPPNVSSFSALRDAVAASSGRTDEGSHNSNDTGGRHSSFLHRGDSLRSMGCDSQLHGNPFPLFSRMSSIGEDSTCPASVEEDSWDDTDDEFRAASVDESAASGLCADSLKSLSLSRSTGDRFESCSAVGLPSLSSDNSRRRRSRRSSASTGTTARASPSKRRSSKKRQKDYFTSGADFSPWSDSYDGRDSVDGRVTAYGVDTVDGRPSGIGRHAVGGRLTAVGRDTVDGRLTAIARDSVDGRPTAFVRDSVDGRLTASGRHAIDGRLSAIRRDTADGRFTAIGRDTVDGLLTDAGGDTVDGLFTATGGNTVDGQQLTAAGGGGLTVDRRDTVDGGLTFHGRDTVDGRANISEELASRSSQPSVGAAQKEPLAFFNEVDNTDIGADDGVEPSAGSSKLQEPVITKEQSRDLRALRSYEKKRAYFKKYTEQYEQVTNVYYGRDVVPFVPDPSGCAKTNIGVLMKLVRTETSLFYAPSLRDLMHLVVRVLWRAVQLVSVCYPDYSYILGRNGATIIRLPHFIRIFQGSLEVIARDPGPSTTRKEQLDIAYKVQSAASQGEAAVGAMQSIVLSGMTTTPSSVVDPLKVHDVLDHLKELPRYTRHLLLMLAELCRAAYEMSEPEAQSFLCRKQPFTDDTVRDPVVEESIAYCRSETHKFSHVFLDVQITAKKVAEHALGLYKAVTLLELVPANADQPNW